MINKYPGNDLEDSQRSASTSQSRNESGGVNPHGQLWDQVRRLNRLLRSRKYPVRKVVPSVLIALLGVYLAFQIVSLPSIGLIEKYQLQKPIQIYDCNNRFVTTIQPANHHTLLPAEDIPSQVQDAVLAAEDHNFFQHHGIDPLATLRAFFIDLGSGKVVEGGSTITQQLAKNLFYEGEPRTIDRKFKEAILAMELESRYSKQEILQMYLSQVYFGRGAYGIEQAANRYFNKHAFELSLAESAYLAALVREPTELSKPENLGSAIKRQHLILDKMVAYGYATKEEAAEAKVQSLAFAGAGSSLDKYQYYTSYVLQTLADRFGTDAMWQGGYVVYTNLDPVAQAEAESVLQNTIKRAPPGITQEALVSIKVNNGAVVAIVGGAGGYSNHQWNCATAPHTVGSAFKPFVYLAAFEKGILTPDSIIDDTPLAINGPGGTYAPKDYDQSYLGSITCRDAIALSRNVCAVRAAQMTGIDDVVNTARLCGITSKLDPNLSLALGSSAVSPLEMANAYATFARNGQYIEPQVIRQIKNFQGATILQDTPQAKQVFQPGPIEDLVDCLHSVVTSGTGRQAALSDRPVAGKTGTADKRRDVWFIGFTPDMVTAVWGGNDQDAPVAGSNVTGGSVMASVWRQYNQVYYETHPTEPGSLNIPNGGGIFGIFKDLFGSGSGSDHPHHGGFVHRLKEWFSDL